MRDNSRTSMMKISIHATLSVQRRKARMFLSVLAFAVICILGTVWPMAGVVYAESGQTNKLTQGQTDVQRLEGRSVRPDGGYTLELW